MKLFLDFFFMDMRKNHSVLASSMIQIIWIMKRKIDSKYQDKLRSASSGLVSNSVTQTSLLFLTTLPNPYIQHENTPI